MTENDAAFIERLKTTRGLPSWSDVERYRRIERDAMWQRIFPPKA